MNNKQEAALRQAREALQYVYEGANNQGPHTGISWRCASNKVEPVIAAIDEALADNALDKMADNAKELGLDYEPIVEQVEDSVGMGHGAWDMVEPKKLAKAFHEALAEQPAQPCGYPYCGCNSKAWCKVEQQSGIKQVIELYDSPEQPAQQDYWQEEARRYAQNAEFWRGKYEAATAQQQERVMWGVDWGRAGDQPCVSIIQRLPNGGIEVLATEYGPPASKPWQGLTEEDRLEIWKKSTNIDGAINATATKLREKNNG